MGLIARLVRLRRRARPTTVILVSDVATESSPVFVTDHPDYPDHPDLVAVVPEDGSAVADAAVRGTEIATDQVAAADRVTA